MYVGVYVRRCVRMFVRALARADLHVCECACVCVPARRLGQRASVPKIDFFCASDTIGAQRTTTVNLKSVYKSRVYIEHTQ